MSIQVLLADDHQIVREGLKVLLEREGFDVVAEASNGQQAVQMSEKFHPDVAVLDLAMRSAAEWARAPANPSS